MKVVRLNIDLAQVKQEIEKRLLEKDEEFQVSFMYMDNRM